MSKVLNNLKASHPDKIENVERDDTGYIIYLTDDWVETSDPLRPSGMIFEDTVAECLSAFRSIRKRRPGETVE